MSNDEQNKNPFSLIADFEGDIENLFNVKIDDQLPIVPLRNMVLFPGVVIPVIIERQFSLDAIKWAKDNDRYIGVVCQKNAVTNTPSASQLYKTGTVAKVMRILDMPEGRVTVLLQGFCRFRIEKLLQTEPYYLAEVKRLRETKVDTSDNEFQALVDACRDLTVRLFKLNNGGREDAAFALKNISNTIFLVNFICSNVNATVKEKMELLEIANVKERAYHLLTLLNREVQYASLKANIQERAREELDEQQKDYFLQQQIKTMQEELGENPIGQDIRDLEEKGAKKKWPDKVKEVFEKELTKLEHLNPQSPDYNVQLNYLETLVNVPWGENTKDNIDIANAQRILDKDHYGLEKVKERILEHLAVIKQRGDFKSPILCLYGPPGIGKTSLGKSIAKALKRKYVRISLGGVHDEAEIRGHRRTYVGAMPGRIIQSLIKCGSNNPVFVLDEIDKISEANINGDPSSALLEVLDPEQNVAFHDNYLDVDYDLSNILFIATANSLSTIPAPLLDRMELIEMTGYITEEKIEIAKRHLIPKEKEAAGFKKDYKVTFPKATIEKIIEQYTRESGVRQLEKRINEIFRKLAFRNVKGKEEPIHVVPPESLHDFLGKPTYIRDIYQGNEYAGVVTGLAWTSVGGEILFIETSLSRGKGSKLTLTGNLGDVMKESAMLALEYIKANADKLGIDYRIFDNWNIHIHVPEGAVPKDGPSAGITIATSIASALTQRKVRNAIAMTGEITLRGKVLPVGGIKEKILAAKRAGINTIILSRENRSDIEEIPEIYVKGITFEYVENVQEVLDLALLDEKIDNPIDFTIPKDEEDKDKKQE
jgi:ATP-dependent Lon protease